MTVVEAVAAIRAQAGLTDDDSFIGPVPLDRCFQAANVMHVAIANLSCAAVIDWLVAERFVSGPHVLAEVAPTLDKLEGFLFWSGADGLAFVNATDILPRRRFTAAHELGHAILHRDRMGRFRADHVIDLDDLAADTLEIEANRFAVELLMPAAAVRARAAAFQKEHGCCPRAVVEYRFAADMLVSAQAMRYRLRDLEVGHA